MTIQIFEGRWWAICAAAALSCARAPSAATLATEPVGVTTRQETPLTVSWVVVEATEKSVKLVARVDRRAALAVPVKVAVAAPKGATLTTGAAAFSISASDGPSVTDTEYVISFATPPLEDLVLTADANGGGLGVHAQDVYRFGRAAPVAPTPDPSGPHLQVGGQDLGGSVPLKQ